MSTGPTVRRGWADKDVSLNKSNLGNRSQGGGIDRTLDRLVGAPPKRRNLGYSGGRFAYEVTGPADGTAVSAVIPVQKANAPYVCVAEFTIEGGNARTFVVISPTYGVFRYDNDTALNGWLLPFSVASDGGVIEVTVAAVAGDDTSGTMAVSLTGITS